MQDLHTIDFRNEFVGSFPGDNSGETKPRQTPGMLYSKALPTKVKQVKLLAWSDELAQTLGLNKPVEQNNIDILGGNFVTPSMHPYAACYAGHQFGNWAGQLGDGRAITLGELLTPGGKTFELQLKGGGRTAYSRSADGRAVLRSSVREYLMSEAMHYLGVPTTRALSLVSTGDAVLRDMFYNGNPQYEPGAIVMRVAPSFLRFGNFEMLAARQEIDSLQNLTDWTVARYYPHITGSDKTLRWFEEVVQRTALLMTEWLRVGFVHGVMNTDNMSILGLTIDYGPNSFVDDYDLNFTPNTTDLPGRRYAFGQQASVGKWNLGCLGSAIAPMFENTDELVKILDGYDGIFWNAYYEMMAAKTGIGEVRHEDIKLFSAFDKMLATLQPDMTIFFQLLIDLPFDTIDKEKVVAYFAESFYSDPSEQEAELLYNLMVLYRERIQSNSISEAEAKRQMRAANPRLVLRNYLLHQAIENLEQGDDTLFEKMQEAMKEPYSNKFDEFLVKRPAWAAQKAGCSMLSCSS